ncbi:hypothetical protein [Streptomyces sp. NPDC059909]|uniref:hypothetical protein n=1 Tax=Streptomyces sp. NPDC059909 TaxID=3346998 RepID=UPI00364BF3F8
MVSIDVPCETSGDRMSTMGACYGGEDPTVNAPSLTAPTSPWVVVTRSDDPWVTAETAALEEQGGLVLGRDGRELGEPAALFRTFARELSFAGHSADRPGRENEGGQASEVSCQDGGMTPSAPGDALSSALRDARSPSWSVRAAAGRYLAGAAEDAEVAAVLHRLLLDGQDTAVTQETAEALLERGDVCGLRMVLAALTRADDDAGDHLDAAINNVYCQSDEGLAQLDKLSSALVSDADASIGREADRILGGWGSRR